MKNKNAIIGTISLVVGLVLAAVSMFYTGALFYESGTGFTAYVFLAMGLCIDTFKYVSSIAAGHYWAVKREGMFLLVGTLCLIATITSYACSVAHSENATNKIIIEAIAGSTAVVKGEDTYNKTSTRIDQLTKEILVMKQDRDKNVKDRTAGLEAAKKEAKRLNYITTKNTGVIAIQGKIDAIAGQIDQDIRNKETELATASQNLVGINSEIKSASSTDEVKTTKGFMALAGMMNSKNPKKACGQIIMLLHAIVEIFSIAAFMIYGAFKFGGSVENLKHYVSPETQEPQEKKSFLNRWFGGKKKPVNASNTETTEAKKTNNINNGPCPQYDPADPEPYAKWHLNDALRKADETWKQRNEDEPTSKQKNPIGFKHEPDPFPTPEKSIDVEIAEAVRLYARTILPKIRPNNSCIGLDAVATETDYNRDKLRKAKSFLEHSGALYVKGMTTFVQDLDKLKYYA